MHYFFGKPLIPRNEQKYIQKLLSKYKGLAADETLKKTIWDELQMEKHKGNITVPFKLALRRDKTGAFPSYIEIILDTKV